MDNEPSRPANGNRPNTESSLPAPVYSDKANVGLVPAAAEVPGERYELRDPFTELTYRAHAFKDIVAEAMRLGSERFAAVDGSGRRTTIRRVDGEWQRGSQRDPPPLLAREHNDDVVTTRDDVPQLDDAQPPSRSIAAAEQATARTTLPERLQADRDDLTTRIQVSLTDRFIVRRAPVTLSSLTIGETEYRFRADPSRVAFTASTFQLTTRINSPAIAKAMVDVAQARHWQGLRVTGSDDFRRLVWLEASLRALRVLGYEPTAADRQVLTRLRDGLAARRFEPAPPQPGGTTSEFPDHSAWRSGATRDTVPAAIETVLVAKQVPSARREAVLAAAAETLAQRARTGESPRIRVLDPAAPSRKYVEVPDQERQRFRHHPSHSR